MKYKIWLKVPKINRFDGEDRRGPSLETIQKHLEYYCAGFRGIIVLHDSMYNYMYDTKSLRYYNTVDSVNIIGHIESSVIENGKLYIIAILDDEKFDSTKDYLCVYRAEMRTNPENNKELMVLNFFSVDLINVEINERTPAMVFSDITKVEDVDDLEKGDV